MSRSIFVIPHVAIAIGKVIGAGSVLAISFYTAGLIGVDRQYGNQKQERT